uniref:Uncharacterized protein n=2 Tax=Graphocephala atropunctata TaxID=36148 RepID=A0A1B6KJE4_9HEMI
MTRLLLDQCCLCFPLKTGCILIGFFYMTFQLKDLVDAVKILLYLEPEENEDQENIEQRDYAYVYYTIKLVIGALLSILAVVILVGIFRKKLLLLKVCAIIMACSSFIPTFQSIITKDPFNAYKYCILALISCLYFGWILWSYAVELEKSIPPPIVYIRPPAEEEP